jgi:phosphatidate cytidylyltransferase
MKNVVQRLLLFFLALPLAAALIIFLPQYRHGAAVVAILVLVGGCALEMAMFFRAKGIAASPLLSIALGLALPLGAYLGELLSRGEAIEGACLGLVLMFGLALEASFSRFAFSKAEEIQDVLPRACALSFAAIYPGLFGAFVILIATEPRYATESLLCFCILAFGNDSLAWLVGMTLGRRRNIIAVSPNKSIAGFIGGICGSIGLTFASSALFPQAMRGRWWEELALGLVVGAAVIVGDLFESALKRSAGIKDSGSAVPGRGGFLDTFDSLLFAAPAFYGLSLLLGYFH